MILALCIHLPSLSLLQPNHGESESFVFWQYYLWRVAFPNTQRTPDFLWNHYSSQVIDSSDNASCSHVVCPPLCPTSVGRLFRVIMNQRTYIYVKIRFLSADGDFFRFILLPFKKHPDNSISELFSYLLPQKIASSPYGLEEIAFFRSRKIQNSFSNHFSMVDASSTAFSAYKDAFSCSPIPSEFSLIFRIYSF